MHRGVYVGELFQEQKCKILVLGESHYGSSEDDKGKPGTFTSEDVVKSYLAAKRGEIKMDPSWYFFTKIAHCFDYKLNRAETIDFWRKHSEITSMYVAE